jgi:hypothetical protein
MSVIVNEFEVVPEPVQPAPASRRDPAPDRPASDVERDVKRVLDTERERAARLHAC